MWTSTTDQHLRRLAEEAFVGLKAWRQQHPTATVREIEAALDERPAKLHARQLQDAALASAAADLATANPR